MGNHASVILFNKPFGVLCQFSGDEKNLSNFINEKGFYPAD
jgi:23S rRNA pseudouridine2457 synthase